MEREIKFRGMRGDGYGWVYGYYYYKWRTQQHIIHCSGDPGVFVDKEFEVNPKTVGQFAAPKDGSERDFFEGDIIETEYGAKGILFWNQDTLSFNFNTEEPMWLHPVHGMGGDKKVIGNIHDNPELL